VHGEGGVTYRVLAVADGLIDVEAVHGEGAGHGGGVPPSQSSTREEGRQRVMRHEEGRRRGHWEPLLPMAPGRGGDRGYDTSKRHQGVGDVTHQSGTE
jgi:hypothetical protein